MPAVIQFILGATWWVIAFPVVWMLSTPFILLFSCFGNGRYLDEVKRHYKSVTDFWKEHGILLVP